MAKAGSRKGLVGWRCPFFLTPLAELGLSQAFWADMRELQIRKRRCFLYILHLGHIERKVRGETSGKTEIFGKLPQEWDGEVAGRNSSGEGEQWVDWSYLGGWCIGLTLHQREIFVLQGLLNVISVFASMVITNRCKRYLYGKGNAYKVRWYYFNH